MKLTIHRGTNQIGGCVTEIESNGYKIFIDFGEQLPGMEKIELPPIEGLTCGDVSKSALFISHYHSDHIGKIGDTVADLSIYVGETALEIYKCLETRRTYIRDNPEVAERHKKNVERAETIITFKALQKIIIGGITVTPLFVDHSAFDAYMFVIEAEGKRLLHTGDFRGHGFRSKELIPTLKRHAKNIDYIISEGSNVPRPDAIIQTEQELQKDFETQFRKNKYNFVLTSSSNIDRILALYHAAKKAKRCFVCDVSQAKILKIVSENYKEHTQFYNIDYDQTTNPAGRFFVFTREGFANFSQEGTLKSYLEKYGFCMLIRANKSFQPLLEEYSQSSETKMFYSMWEGYLDSTDAAFSESLYNFVKPYHFETKHTSGHAYVDTLHSVFDTIRPKSGIIPIHTEAPEKFQELFSNHTIIVLKDGDSINCNQ